MDHWSAVSVSPCPFDVVMDRVTIRRDCLERRCVCIRECSTRRAKHLADSQDLKLACRHNEEFVGIKGLGNFTAASTYIYHCLLLSRDPVISRVRWRPQLSTCGCYCHCADLSAKPLRETAIDTSLRSFRLAAMFYSTKVAIPASG